MPSSDIKLVSFGPCQTPTLAFCVDQHERVTSHRSEKSYSLQCEVTLPSGDGSIKLDYSGEAFKSESDAESCLQSQQTSPSIRATLTAIDSKQHERPRPKPLNTVELLKLASTHLSLSPASTMDAAERLYCRGYISYPRTETTRYPPALDIHSIAKRVVSDQMAEEWSGGRWRSVGELLGSGQVEEPRDGEDKGDHPPIYPLRAGDGELSGGGLAW